MLFSKLVLWRIDVFEQQTAALLLASTRNLAHDQGKELGIGQAGENQPDCATRPLHFDSRAWQRRNNATALKFVNTAHGRHTGHSEAPHDPCKAREGSPSCISPVADIRVETLCDLEVPFPACIVCCPHDGYIIPQIRHLQPSGIYQNLAVLCVSSEIGRVCAMDACGVRPRKPCKAGLCAFRRDINLLGKASFAPPRIRASPSSLHLLPQPRMSGGGRFFATGGTPVVPVGARWRPRRSRQGRAAPCGLHIDDDGREAAMRSRRQLRQ